MMYILDVICFEDTKLTQDSVPYIGLHVCLYFFYTSKKC